MRASATKLAGRSDRQFPSSPNDNAQMKDVISSAGMRAEAYGERKTKSMPVAQEQLRGEFFPHAILWKERMWVHLLRQMEKGQIFLVDVLFWQGRRKSWTTVFNNENKNVTKVEKMILRVFGLELFLVAFYKDA